VTFIKKAITFIKGAVIFISKRGLAIKRSFKTARVRVSDIKEVNKCNLKWRLIIYKLKSLLLLIYSLISLFNYFIRLFL
jgi:hypothetical protein